MADDHDAEELADRIAALDPDRRALLERLRSGPDHRVGRPTRSPAEQALATVWSEVLGVDVVGADDNFFDLGGDSILTLQIVSRARRAGLAITPKLLMTHPTVAELASVAERVSPATPASTSRTARHVAGPGPLSPVQLWLVETGAHRSHDRDQNLFFEFIRPVEPAVVGRALAEVACVHPAFRTRLRQVAGDWQLFVADEGPVADLSVHELTGSASHIEREIERVAGELQRRLDPVEGPVALAALFRLPASQPDRLFLTAHHLIVDGVSARVLAEDLDTACRAISTGRAPQIAPEITSFPEWVSRLAEGPDLEAALAEQSYWEAVPDPVAASLPVDSPPTRTVPTRGARLTSALSPEDTEGLVHIVPRVTGARTNEAIFAAMLLAFRDRTGRDVLQVDLEGHGRESAALDVDLSRTVGWFTSIFPFVGRVEPGADDPMSALRATSEQLRGIPRGGVGYGVLRHLTGVAVASRLAALPASEMSFNYMGQFAAPATDGDGVLGPPVQVPSLCPEDAGAVPYLIELVTSIVDGQFAAEWIYREPVHDRATIVGLDEAFRGHLAGLVERARRDRSGLAHLVRPVGSVSRSDIARVLDQVGGGSRRKESHR